MKSYEGTFGGDARFDTLIGQPYAQDFAEAKQPLNSGVSRFYGRAIFDAVVKGIPMSVAAQMHHNNPGALRPVLGLGTKPITWPTPLALHVENWTRSAYEDYRLVATTGEPFMWRGNTAFTLFARYRRGDDILPIVRERREAGCNILRVFCEVPDWAGDLQLTPQVGDTKYLVDMQGLTRLLAGEGMRIEWVGFTGDAIPQLAAKQKWWSDMWRAISSEPNAFVELTNEDHLGNDGQDALLFERPQGILACIGSRTGSRPPLVPGWDYHTFHVRRDYPSMLKDAANIELIAGYPSYPGTHGVTIHDEIFPCNRPNGGNYVDPKLFEAFGRMAGAVGGGATFHGDKCISTLPWGQVERDCAVALYGGLIASSDGNLQ